MYKALLTVCLLLTILFFRAEASPIVRPGYLNPGIEDATESRVLDALDELFAAIDNGSVADRLLVREHAGLTKSSLSNLRAPAPDEGNPEGDRRQLINFYSLSPDRYFLTIAITDSNFEEEEVEESASPPAIKMIVNLVAQDHDGSVEFAIPLQHMTRHWKSETVGRVTYHFRSTLNRTRASHFDSRNTAIAEKLGVAPEAMDFYMCDDYQEILALIGFQYDRESNGMTRDGYGVDDGVIFSIMNNEDFSHDIFHYYSGKINRREDRNGITEEGVAYSWGNAYYTDPAGEMIEQRALVEALAQYLAANPGASARELFENNRKIFDLAPEASALSTISSLICDEVERREGMPGLLELINCGRKDAMDRYFETIDRLVGINRGNFNERVGELIERYE